MTVLKTFSGALSALAVLAFGTDVTNIKWLWALIFFMALDFLMGIHDAKVKKTFCRRELFNGMYRKFMMFFMVIIGHEFDTLNFIGDGSVLIQRGITGYLIGYEMLSIVTHITFAGVAIPDILKNAINNFASKNGNNGDGTK